MIFLEGLDDSIHGVVRSQLCAITPLPDLDSVYQTIVSNEMIQSNASKEVTVMGFASQTPSSMGYRSSALVWTRDVLKQSANEIGTFRAGTSNRDPSRQCIACGRQGHEASSCFKIV